MGQNNFMYDYGMMQMGMPQNFDMNQFEPNQMMMNQQMGIDMMMQMQGQNNNTSGK